MFLKQKVLLTELHIEIHARTRILRSIHAALLPECANGKRCRLSMKLKGNGRKLVLAFRAKDTVSLRASLNTNLRLATTAIMCIEAAKTKIPISKSQKDSIERIQRMS